MESHRWNTTYLADNVIPFRDFEAGGSVRPCHLRGQEAQRRHERTIRELDMDERGVLIGEPLTDFHGILTGVPAYLGRNAKLMEKP